MFPVKKCKIRWLRQIYAVVVAVLAFVVFRAESLSQAGLMFQMMFTGVEFTPENISNCVSILNPLYLATFFAALVGAMPIKKKLEQIRQLQGLSYGICMVLLVLCICRLSADAYNPFIYFRF